MSSTWKNSAISFASGAPPEIPKRIRPPSFSFTFEKTSLSASLCWAARPRGIGLPCCRSLLTRRPTPSAQSISFFFTPVASSKLGQDGRVHLLVDAGDARQHRGPHGRRHLADAQRIGAERRREAHVRRQQVQAAAEVVRQRQVEQDGVLGADEGGTMSTLATMS